MNYQQHGTGPHRQCPPGPNFLQSPEKKKQKGGPSQAGSDPTIEFLT